MVNVLFFAHLKDAAGQESATFEAAGKSVAELKQLVIEQFPDIQTLDSIMTAINEEFSSDTDTLNAGDTVAFIPPVSGG